MRPLDPRLRILGESPLNAETSLAHQAGVITPVSLFYHRNHFPFPSPPESISIGGDVRRPFTLSPAQLLELPSRTMLVTLECAGNGRMGLQPPAEGEPWAYGAVSTAEWTGVPLAAILERAGPAAATSEIVIAGADRGPLAAAGGEIAYVRSVPLRTALDGDMILAYAMNGEPLPAEHGGPCRLIVPGWYGMASVKWVERIEAVSAPFRGFYQADRYVMPAEEGAMRPLTTMGVRSVICRPGHGTRLPPGRWMVEGLAWSGEAPVVRVEVSENGGATWREAQLTSREERYAWRRWQCPWDLDRRGTARMRSRAVDAAGNGQPDMPVWNRLGYANNAIHGVDIIVE